MPALRATTDRRALLLAVGAMALVVVASNILVQHPITAFGLQDWLTFGAFTYPFAFLVTDLANRRFGPAGARRVVYVGFALAVVLSIWFATPRIAMASGVAFLTAQLLDVAIFDALRRRAWWVAPLASSVLASAVDTALFFGLAFHCEPLIGGASITQILGAVGIPDACIALPWQTLALADWGVKLAVSTVALVPYGMIVARMRRAEDGAGATGAA